SVVRLVLADGSEDAPVDVVGLGRRVVELEVARGNVGGARSVVARRRGRLVVLPPVLLLFLRRRRRGGRRRGGHGHATGRARHRGPGRVRRSDGATGGTRLGGSRAGEDGERKQDEAEAARSEGHATPSTRAQAGLARPDQGRTNGQKPCRREPAGTATRSAGLAL